MGFLQDFFEGGNDEILFFIVLFLVVFSGNWRNRTYDGFDEDDGSSALFFIVLFILLFFNSRLEDGNS